MLRLTPVDPIIHGLKRNKDPDELELIRRSVHAGEAGHLAGLQQIKPGMTELEAYLLVQQAALRQAGDTALVYGDFVSGPRCEQVGGPPTDRVINKGDLVLLDFSVVINGYRADFANTFVCGGKPSAEQLRLYVACLDALAEGERAIKPGRAAREIDEAVRHSFDAKHLRDSFTTHSGHGLGLGHPDPPYLVPESTDTLVAGDVIAIEPGQYIPGVAGMRFERNYLVTETGFEVLSKHALQIDQTA
jgi:Xaa-Pro aminopeptidase